MTTAIGLVGWVLLITIGTLACLVCIGGAMLRGHEDEQ